MTSFPICHLPPIYFKSIHNEELHYLAEQLITFRKNKCKFISKMAKQSALIGLGRFALNIGKTYT